MGKSAPQPPGPKIASLLPMKSRHYVPIGRHGRLRNATTPGEESRDSKGRVILAQDSPSARTVTGP
eukprot:346961-Rhodomonas_salina.2